MWAAVVYKTAAAYPTMYRCVCPALQEGPSGTAFVEHFVARMLADVLGHDVLHLAHGSHVVETQGDGVQFLQVAVGILILVAAHLGYAYLLVE